MKLISSKGKGRRVIKEDNKSVTTQKAVKAEPDRRSSEDTPASKRNKTKKKASVKKKVLFIVLTIIVLALLFGVSVLAVVRWEIQPFYDYFFKPGVEVLAEQPEPNIPSSSNNSGEPEMPNVEANPGGIDPEPENPSGAIETVRDVSKFTFLVFGIDDYTNTDVIMVVAFDTSEYTLEVVSIPRDTMVNVSWNLKKANSIQSQMRHRYRNENDAEEMAMQATVDHFRDILGFNVDFWININMRGFITLINAVGPIEFNVPRGVEGVPSGNQRLNGHQAMEVIRQRALYANADLGRVNTQQNFLQAAANQILARRNSISVTDYANVLIGNVKTNIQLNHLVWFGRELLKLDSSDINFTVMPGALDGARNQSYVAIDVDEWLEIVNSLLSPLTREITSDDVSILTRGSDRRLYVTDGNWQGDSSWGASSR